MMGRKKMKVVWICHFSDEKTREKIIFSRFYFVNIYRFIAGKPSVSHDDMAIWVSNAIKEFEKFEDISLTVIFPHKAIKGHNQSFSINGVEYICFRSEDDTWKFFVLNKLFRRYKNRYINNRAFIKKQLIQINPDIIHVIGAENPYYSISALDIPDNKPCLLSLQTLMSDPLFYKNYPINPAEYAFRSGLEKEIIKKNRYIGSSITRYKEIVLKDINPNAVFLNIPLAVGLDMDLAESEKFFDFVYFSADISKAADDAIEAFALASKQRPGITLNISGGYSECVRQTLDQRIEELGIVKQVFFTGSQSKHSDVLKQIKKSRFALLPLKIDMISGTIREAMACGLPVVSTITPETPNLNKKRESILLSEKGNYEAMAENMLRLLNDKSLEDRLKKNSADTIWEMYSNVKFMSNWRKAYYDIIANFNDGLPLTRDLLLV